MLRLLGQLNEQELLQSDQAADIDALVKRRNERRKSRRRRLLNPFAFRLPLADPSHVLARLDPLAKALFHAGRVLALAGDRRAGRGNRRQRVAGRARTCRRTTCSAPAA